MPCYAVVGRDDLDAFGRHLMNLEVESASVNGQVEDAARRLARRLI